MMSLEERCRQLIMERRYEECEKEIEASMANQPHDAIPHNLMGILMEKEGKHSLAMKHFRAAYALEPSYTPARYNMDQYGQLCPSGKCAYTEDDCPKKKEKQSHWNLECFQCL